MLIGSAIAECPTLRSGGLMQNQTVDQNQMLDEILLCLADEFEGGSRVGRTIEPKTAEEFEPLRELLAMQVAEGWLHYQNFRRPQCVSADERWVREAQATHRRATNVPKLNLLGLWCCSADYFARPSSSVFSIRTLAAGYIIRIVRLALCASASFVNSSDMTRTPDMLGANTR